MKCSKCGADIPQKIIAAEIGKHTSDKKAKASRENGAKGGRPKKLIYRVLMICITHDKCHLESTYFSSKAESLKFARSSDCDASIYKNFGEDYGWHQIWNKPKKGEQR